MNNNPPALGQNLRLGIVTPMANERDDAVRFVSETLSVCEKYGFARIQLYTVLDNVCTDGTVDLLRELAATEPRLRVVWAPENRCVVDAYKRGYREALDQDDDWILEIDAGFSHDPGQIPRLFEAIAAGHDCVFGVRFGLPEAKFIGNAKRRLISRGGTWLANTLLGTGLHDMTSGYELFSQAALRQILADGIHSRGPFFQTEIRSHAHRLNLAEVPISYQSPSHHVGGSALLEAISGLWRLRQQQKSK